VHLAVPVDLSGHRPRVLAQGSVVRVIFPRAIGCHEQLGGLGLPDLAKDLFSQVRAVKHEEDNRGALLVRVF
jgi:hypothetical protein